jgi:Cu2+-exporting ATPase
MEKIEIVISGMNCESCATSVEHKFLGVPGIETAKVNLVGKSAVIEYDKSQISSESIYALDIGNFKIIHP